MTTPLHVRPLSSNTVRLWNALACHLLPTDIELDNDQPAKSVARLTCSVTNEGTFTENAAFTLYVNLNGVWRIEFDNLDVLTLRPELAEWLHADVDNRFALLPETLLRAALERLFLPVLDNISRLTGLPAIFVSPPRVSTRPMFTEYLDFLLWVEAEQPVSTLLRIAWQDTATLLPLVEKIEAHPLLPLSAQIKALLLPAYLSARLILGQMLLTSKEITSLNNGDVLLSPDLLSLKPHLHLSPKFNFACVLEDNTLTVSALETLSATSGEQSMSNPANTTNPPNSQTQTAPLLDQNALDTLEVDISFELPGLKIPLAECSRLAPGYTFTLSADVAHLPVTVRAGGRVVALGQLVDVGGMTGVQITQVKDAG